MATVESIRVDRCIYEKPAGSGSYWVVKRNKWIGPFKSIEEARAKRDEIERKQTTKPIGGPFADFYYQYYKPNYLDNLKANTQKIWSESYKVRIIPFFQNKRIGEITKIDCLDFRRNLQGRFAIITINKTMQMLRVLFKYAIELNFIEENPCVGIKKLTESEKERPTLSETEILKLINSIDHPYSYAIALAGLAGGRAGEIVGFKWQDFDFTDENKGWISFYRQINILHEIDNLKSKASSSTLPLLPALTNLLIQYKKKCPDDEWLFQGEVKKYISKLENEYSYKYHRKPNKSKYEFSSGHSLSMWWIKRVQGKYNVPQNMRFHDLRHSFATNICDRCKNPKLAQTLCRHATADITLNIYAHIRPEHLEMVWDWTF